MDASALLVAQGWRGSGHTLHATTDSRGLAKPLLLSRNSDNRGVGALSSAQHTTSNQWWMAAFDQQLKGLDVSKEEAAGKVAGGSGDGGVEAAVGEKGKKGKRKGMKDGEETTVRVVQMVVDGGLNQIAPGKNMGSLYASFVRGGTLNGTLGNEEDERERDTADGEDTTPANTTESEPVSRNDSEDDAVRSKAERRARKEARRLKREAKLRKKSATTEGKEGQKQGAANNPTGVAEVTSGETKAERRARKEERRLRRATKEARNAAR